jgi:hypothetical protein
MQAPDKAPGAGVSYLSKDGKIFGPYTDEELENLRRSGEINTFSWIWGGGSSNWMPIAAPPPMAPPGAGAQSAAPQPQAQAAPVVRQPPADEASVEDAPYLLAGDPPAPAAQSGLPSFARPSGAGAAPAVRQNVELQAICHDGHQIVSGLGRSVTGEGFLLVSEGNVSASSPFRRGGKIWVNLLDESSRRTENVQAVVSDFTRKQSGWEYQIRWVKVPGLIAL